MNIYDAIMKAADQIEANPETFDFERCIPDPERGTAGCALGWICLFAGIERNCIFPDIWDHTAVSDAMDLPEVPDPEFYCRMDNLADGWRWSADLCAHALRLYANKYHSNVIPFRKVA